MAAIHAFYDLRCRDLNLLNKVAIVLLPKKEGAEDVRNFRPISLIHAVAKIITKVLALRLAPLLSQLISTTQSAFIKKRSIHDNFLYVRNLTRRFHRTKTPTLLLKLDISKAFDSVRWDCLLSLMQHRGFPTRWQNWITALLSSSTSRVMLNGSPLLPIQHGRGMHQGDPLSPLLFILAIEPLNQLLQVATDRGLLTKLNGRAARFRISMYADDVVVFLKPSVTDATNLRDLLLNFGQVTGLQTNLQKTTVSTISCDNIDLEVILAALPIARAHFPRKYLRLPLSPYRLRKLDFQPQIDKAAAKLSAWNGKNLTQAGRVSLTKSVLSSQPVYLLLVIKPPKEVLDDIDKLRRRFLWVGDKALSGGKCKVNWTKTSLPKKFSGLDILNLHRFASALRLRWLWHEWTSPDKAWVGTEVPCTEQDRLLFAACTTITLGDGHKASFWSSGWLLGRRTKDIAPLLFRKSNKKNWSVAEVLHDNAWIRDLGHRTGFTTAHLSQFVMLWNLVQGTALRHDQEDRITWSLTLHGEYTAASAYLAQFNGCIAAPDIAIIWKTWAPPKCKLFSWLIFQNRVWTSDRLARREWDHCPSCPLCRQTMEIAHHLLASCRYTQNLGISGGMGGAHRAQAGSMVEEPLKSS
jgi:mannosylglycoprotein endo-beta-mannosidase